MTKPDKHRTVFCTAPASRGSFIKNGLIKDSFIKSRICRSLILAVVAAQAVSVAPVSAKPKAPTSSTAGLKSPGQEPPLQTKLHGQISAFGMACASAGVIPLSTELPTTVEEVKRGSQAFYAGVVAGDQILQATIEKNQLNLKIQRNGHIYLATMQAKMDDSRPISLDNGLSQDKLTAILRSYQIRLIVDHSGSMYRPLGSSDKLRWTWVKEELDRFCTTVERKTGSKFDLYLFNETVDIAANQSARQIQTSLNEAVTTGNTYLPAALRAATADSPRPVLIILVTDGQAVSSRENGPIVADNLSRSAILRRSRIVFLQAGYSPEGASFIACLNDAMKSRGMGKQAYTVLFEEASRRGILGAIEPLIMQ